MRRFALQTGGFVVDNSTWRLTFSYDGDSVSLASAQRVAMRAPPVVTEAPSPAPAASGSRSATSRTS